MTQPIQLIAEIYAVEVPEGAINFTVDMGYLIFKVPNYANWCNDSILSDPVRLMKYVETHKAENDYKTGGIPLTGNWQLICTTKECKKKVPMGIVECKIVEYDGGIKGTRFVNYLNDNQRTWFINKTDSFRSLMVARGLDPENKNYVLIKKLP